jgi:hypothetical protein
MKKYEYKILHVDLLSNNVDVEEFINKYGEQGWKLITATTTNYSKPILYFRRKLKSDVLR